MSISTNIQYFRFKISINIQRKKQKLIILYKKLYLQ